MSMKPLFARAVPTVASAALVLAALGCSKDPRLPQAWGIGVHKLDARVFHLVGPDAKPDPFAARIANTARLKIPTYDGSDQATHPDVVRRPDTGELVMAMTPYPFSEERLENPSIVVSPDGMSFSEPPSLKNPLVPAPPFDHNNDPDIRFDAAAHEYELVYLETEAPVQQTVVSLRSADLVTWRRTDLIRYDLSHGEDFIVSPAVVFDGKTTHMFYVNLSTKSFSQRLEVMTSDDGRTWSKSTKRSLAIDLHGVTPWHLDLVTGPTGYALLISGYLDQFQRQNLYIATSPDLETWTFEPTPLLSYDDASLGVASLYRATGLVSGDALVVWYSMKYRK